MNKIKKSRLFLICNILFIIGIFAGFLIKAKPFYLYIGFLILLTSLIIFYKKNFIKIILLGLCFLALGIWRYNFGLPKINKSHISFYNGEKIEFTGIVKKEPDVRIDHTKLTITAVKSMEVQPPTGRLNLHGNVLIKTKLFPEFEYGDELKINCKLQTPENFNDFAYDKYLARYDIYSVCYYPNIKLLKKDQANKFYAGLYNFKNKLKLIIAQSLPEPHSSLMSGIILGNKRGIPSELIENFNKAGVSHVVAISGMHITILAAILLYLGIIFGLRRGQAFYFSTAFIFLYIILIGLPASAIRAATMGFLFLFAMKLGRLAKATNALLFAASVMLFINPMLVYDIGFQLSFLAVFGLIYILPAIEKFSKKLLKSYEVKGIAKSCLALFLVTISAQITTLPLILYHFGRLSLVAPIVNILIVPFVPFIMVLGLILLTAGLISINLAQIIGWILWLVLSYVIYIVNFFAKLDFGSIDVKVSRLTMVIFLVFILFFIFVKNLRKNKKEPA
jgi:competence protein ComEC